MRLKLATKVLLSFSFLSITSIMGLSLGIAPFQKLEKKLEIVNDYQMPAMRILTQVESTFYLLETDLDKSFLEGTARPFDSLQSVMNSRIEALSKIIQAIPEGENHYQDEYAQFFTSFKSLQNIIDNTFTHWSDRAMVEADLSQKREEFRNRLKTIMKNFEREHRLISLEVQKDVRRIELLLIVLIGFSFLTTFALAIWLAFILRPLQGLTLAMRSISSNGLNEKSINALAAITDSNDDLGTLTRESFRMASSLLVSSKLMNEQKLNLERAHFELAKQNVELRKTQTKLLHSDKLGIVGKMAAQMAHEIRNPLNALSLHTELLEDRMNGNAILLEGLAPIKKEIGRLAALTDGYLDMARAPKLEKSKVQLNHIIEELHSFYSPVLKEKKIHFTCDLHEVPELFIDRAQITQALTNLLKNSVEAFDEESESTAKFVRIITNWNADSKMAELTILDNGVGIPQNKIREVFSPFFTSKASGTGLGLAFSKQVVEDHEGEITFESAANIGTKFTLKFPDIQV